MTSFVPPAKRPIPIFHPSGEQVVVNALENQSPQQIPVQRRPTHADGAPVEVTAPKAQDSATVSTPNPATAEVNGNANVLDMESSNAPRPRPSTSMPVWNSTPHASHAANGSWSPDIYAPSYIPQYLLAINLSPAVDRDCTPLKTADFDAYIRTFAGSNVLGPISIPQMPDIHKPLISLSRQPKALSVSTYLYYFHECLLSETYQHSKELATLNLYDIKMDIFKPDQQLYQLKIPGLKDDAPRVELGDTLLIRQIVPSPQLAQQGAEWYVRNAQTSGSMIAPGFTGQQHHAVVWGVARMRETVILRIDHFLSSLTQCNVIFQVQRNRYFPLWSAVSKVYNGLSCPQVDHEYSWRHGGGLENRSSWMRHMLFPDPEDAVLQGELPQGSFPRSWIDRNLNSEQMKAVDSVTSGNFGTIPFLISGVPGSGKTKTLVECALQLLRTSGDVKPHILICAPSEPAADTLALRLSEHISPEELFRLNGYTRSFAEVPDALMQYTHIEGDTFSLPEFKTMLRYKVIVTSCRAADMLVQARLTNADLVKLTYDTVTSVAPGIRFTPEQAIHWTTLIVDEAAQATEPSVCVPLSVVANPFSVESSGGESTLPIVIMAGDQHQLGPQVYSTETALSVSLFERLSLRPIYADHPLSRRNAGPRKRLTRDMLPIPRPAFMNLYRNYRSHQSILAIPSVLFYSDTLLPSAPPVHPDGPVPTWPVWKRPHHWPILFACNTSVDSVEEILHGPAGSGLYNRGEALKAVYYVNLLLEHSSKLPYNQSHPNDPQPIREDEIAIISPFNSQVAHLRNVFRSYDLGRVNIGPLEAFQGLESRFLIICTTRTRTDPRFVEQDQALGLGLIGERRRFNVALTRAKEGVVVIGNPSLLGTGPVQDEVWRAFLCFCARNRCWDTEKPRHQDDRAPSKRRKKQNHGSSSASTPASGTDAELDDNGAAEARRPASHWERQLGGIADVINGTMDEEKDPRLEGYVSSLEYGLLYEEKLRNSSLAGEGGQLGRHVPAEDAYDSAMWTSGTAAEEVLRGWEDE